MQVGSPPTYYLNGGGTLQYFPIYPLIYPGKPEIQISAAHALVVAGSVKYHHAAIIAVVE